MVSKCDVTSERYRRSVERDLWPILEGHVIWI